MRDIVEALRDNAKYWNGISFVHVSVYDFAKAADEIERLRSQLVKAKEALHHANVDMSMLLPEIGDRDMQKSFRKTLGMIDAIGASND